MEKIAVIGAGTMGHGIAEAFAMYGNDIKLFDISKEALDRAKDLIKSELEFLAEEDYISNEDVEKSLERITFCTDLKKAVEDREYVVEAMVENIELKQELFKKLDEWCPEYTILSSNTSSLKLSDITKDVSEGRKSKCMVNHWYNPAHIMPIAELSFFGETCKETYEKVETLYQSIGKQTVKVLKDIPGLIANRIQQGIAREVFSLIEQGVADAKDIDKAIKFGPAFRYVTTGQLEVTDMGGLDIWCLVGDNLLPEMDNSTEANAILREKVKEGKLGVKSGEGFFLYPEDKVAEIKNDFNKRLITQLKISKSYIVD
jgi:3-hydroxybutyryl-CoA dehydrogenase